MRKSLFRCRNEIAFIQKINIHFFFRGEIWNLLWIKIREREREFNNLRVTYISFQGLTHLRDDESKEPFKSWLGRKKRAKKKYRNILDNDHSRNNPEIEWIEKFYTQIYAIRTFDFTRGMWKKKQCGVRKIICERVAPCGFKKLFINWEILEHFFSTDKHFPLNQTSCRQLLLVLSAH